MTNIPLLHLQDQVNAFLDAREDFWETKARFVGSLPYLRLDDPYQKLRAQLEHVRHHRSFTTHEMTRWHDLMAAIEAQAVRPRAKGTVVRLHPLRPL